MTSVEEFNKFSANISRKMIRVRLAKTKKYAYNSGYLDGLEKALDIVEDYLDNNYSDDLSALYASINANIRVFLNRGDEE